MPLDATAGDTYKMAFAPEQTDFAINGLPGVD
jgi:hypothetical protein